MIEAGRIDALADPDRLSRHDLAVFGDRVSAPFRATRRKLRPLDGLYAPFRD